MLIFKLLLVFYSFVSSLNQDAYIRYPLAIFWFSSLLCSMGIFLMNLAGTPAHNVPGSITVLLNTKAPAATMA